MTLLSSAAGGVAYQPAKVHMHIKHSTELRSINMKLLHALRVD